MQPPAILLWVLLLSVGLAGCLGNDAGSPPATSDPDARELLPTWWRDAVPFGEGHDHLDRAQHVGHSTPNFGVVGHDPLITETLGTQASGMGCGGAATREDGLRLAVAHGFDSDMGIVITDITDPTRPRLVGEYFLPNVDVWDATISADGQHALIAADIQLLPTRTQLPPPPLVEVRPSYRPACAAGPAETGPAQYVPYGPSLMLVSLADPSAPELVDIVPQPVIGPHSVSSQAIDGTVYAISSVTNLVHEASYYHFFEITMDRLVTVTTIQAPGVESTKGRDGLNGHVEAELQRHPVTGQLLAYLANWNDGLRIFDLSQPELPVEVAHAKPDGLGQIHSVLALDELRDGIHYTITGQEVSEGDQEEPGTLILYDTTDPATPVEIARWAPPVKPIGWTWSLQFSTHYFDIHQDTLFVANYHGGLWAVDVTDMTAPTTIGLFIPPYMDVEELSGRGINVEDVIVDDETGILTVWDGDGGIYQLRFDPTVPVPPAPTWYDLEHGHET